MYVLLESMSRIVRVCEYYQRRELVLEPYKRCPGRAAVDLLALIYFNSLLLSLFQMLRIAFIHPDLGIGTISL